MSNSVPSVRIPRVTYVTGASPPFLRFRIKPSMRGRSCGTITLRIDVPNNSRGEETPNSRNAAGLHISQTPLMWTPIASLVLSRIARSLDSLVFSASSACLRKATSSFASRSALFKLPTIRYCNKTSKPTCMVEFASTLNEVGTTLLTGKKPKDSTTTNPIHATVVPAA